MTQLPEQPGGPRRPGDRLLGKLQEIPLRDKSRQDGPALYPENHTVHSSPVDMGHLGGVQQPVETLTRNTTNYVRLALASSVRQVTVEAYFKRDTNFGGVTYTINLDTAHDNPLVYTQWHDPGTKCGIQKATADVNLSVLRLILPVDNSDATHDVDFYYRLRYLS